MAQEFAHAVSIEILRIRGWVDMKTVPPEVRGDVFAIMGEDPDYSRMYRAGVSALDAAKAIQYRAWDNHV